MPANMVAVPVMRWIGHFKVSNRKNMNQTIAQMAQSKPSQISMREPAVTKLSHPDRR
jgi:hypothetical protein